MEINDMKNILEVLDVFVALRSNWIFSNVLIVTHKQPSCQMFYAFEKSSSKVSQQKIVTMSIDKVTAFYQTVKITSSECCSLSMTACSPLVSEYIAR